MRTFFSSLCLLVRVSMLGGLAGCQQAVYPPRLTDQLFFPAFADSDNPKQRDQAKPAFDMVLIPGDRSTGVLPFYLSTHEVRLAMFWPWASGAGMGWNDAEARQRLGFYPSQYLMLYGGDERRFSRAGEQPALAMSRRVAELYCQMISEMTGRAYRLPTEAEWAHAQGLAGGVPSDRQRLLASAVLEESAPFATIFEIDRAPADVGSLPADALGLHDLLGNAAEWVSGTGDERIVRGGHYELPADQLTDGWRAVEDIAAWNATYPLHPRAHAWYRDFPYTGIRLALDADQAPKPAD